jgi:hypothetical protein
MLTYIVPPGTTTYLADYTPKDVRRSYPQNL